MWKFAVSSDKAERRRGYMGTATRGASIALAAGLLLAGETGAAEQKRSGIRILEATYGGNCAGVSKGNVTAFVAATCNNKNLCNYRIYYKDMGGDPAPGCAKAFILSYTCAGSGKRGALQRRGRGRMGRRGWQSQRILPAVLHPAEAGPGA